MLKRFGGRGSAPLRAGELTVTSLLLGRGLVTPSPMTYPHSQSFGPRTSGLRASIHAPPVSWNPEYAPALASVKIYSWLQLCHFLACVDMFWRSSYLLTARLVWHHYIFRVMGSKYQGPAVTVVEIWLLIHWRDWTKTYTMLLSLRPRTNYVLKVSCAKVKVTETFCGRGILIDYSPSKSI